MSEKIMDLLAKLTDGKSYKAHKYSLDDSSAPDIEYGEDSENKILLDKWGETEHFVKYVPLLDWSKKLLTANYNPYSFFLDGSRHVFKVDDIAYQKSGNRTVIYPVVAGQIGVCCTKRVDRRIKMENFYFECDIAVPDIAAVNNINGFFPATVEKLNQSPDLKKLNITFKKIIPYKTSKVEQNKYADKGTALIQARMIELEKEAVASLVRNGKLNQNNYLIKDGSLEYRPSSEEKHDKKKGLHFINNYNWVIGVSKKFNPEGYVDKNKHANPGFIADLPLYHRTPAAMFEYNNIKFAAWYVRIRDKSKTRTPFDGVVKMEKILVTDKENNDGIDTEDVDILSASLINERMPTCYGSDLRWANHIYPIFVTESFIKSRYISTETFLHLF